MNEPDGQDGTAASHPDPVFEALWQRALVSWDNEKSHVALLEHGLREQALPELAARYRSFVGDSERGTIAQKRLDALVVAATQTLFAMKTPKPEGVPVSITLSAFAVCGVLLAWLAWALWGPR